MKRALQLVIAILVCVLGASGARGDDWPFFRRDGWRSALSRDRVTVPLTEIWHWQNPGTSVTQPTSPCTVVGSRVFFIAAESKPRCLVSVDARTGRMLWSRPLGSGIPAALYPGAEAPSVAGSMVWVSDLAAYRPALGTPDTAPGDTRSLTPLPAQVPALVVRSFNAADGAPIGSVVLGVMDRRYKPDLGLARSRIWGGPVPIEHERIEAIGALAEGVGPPLFVRGELLAAGADGALYRWSLTGGTSLGVVEHFYGIDNHWRRARFGGFPVAFAPRGFLIDSDDWHMRWLAIGNGELVISEQSITNVVGVPAVRGDIAYLPVGGPRADRGLLALDLRTGERQWLYLAGAAILEPDSVGVPGDLGDEPLPGAQFPDQIEPGVRGRAAARSAPIARPGQQGGPGHVAPPGSDLRLPPRRLPAVTERQAKGDGGIHHGHRLNAGAVAGNSAVYSVVRGQLVAIPPETGQPAWRLSLSPYSTAVSLIGTKNTLFALLPQSNYPRLPPAILAVDIETGRPLWRRECGPGLDSGSLAVAAGVLYVADGLSLRAYAPAERTYRLAVDSANPEDYLRKLSDPEPSDGAAADAGGENADEAPKAPPQAVHTLAELPTPVAPPKAVAEATVLRLSWRDPLTIQLEQIKARRAVVEDAPMLLVLDWLTADRSSPTEPALLTAAGVERFAEACAALAAAARPTHFDLAPEINVYLARYPDAVPAVVRLLQAAGLAVRLASRGTRVVASFQVEVMRGMYGTGPFLPFGKLTRPPRGHEAKLLPLAAVVDTVGLSTCPQAATLGAPQLPFDYLLRIKALLGNKPCIVSRIHVRCIEETAAGQQQQAWCLERALQCCYWLDAALIACPDAVGASPQNAIRVAGKPRPALQVWQEPLGWRWVEELTAGRDLLRPTPRSPGEPVDPAEPAAP